MALDSFLHCKVTDSGGAKQTPTLWRFCSLSFLQCYRLMAFSWVSLQTLPWHQRVLKVTSLEHLCPVLGCHPTMDHLWRAVLASVSSGAGSAGQLPSLPIPALSVPWLFQSITHLPPGSAEDQVVICTRENRLDWYYNTLNRSQTPSVMAVRAFNANKWPAVTWAP